MLQKAQIYTVSNPDKQAYFKQKKTFLCLHILI